ncbi:hypothetical protein [Hyphomicrobium sulfonivorans]|uniref:hypothetical protein n=1 Tax=Hyphomicrobium sulfonivorans TaxID=121290 RepID=UPI00156E5A5A|nr:hypothetical protein [Hyphomicrobium sulfonivorans]MBI1651317.1 hypothetical protein [Hyphomicrobium sulfonivorans]NSL73284.1 hypothetical protein [Hyphomicrobium sulfonivorans]
MIQKTHGFAVALRLALGSAWLRADVRSCTLRLNFAQLIEREHAGEAAIYYGRRGCAAVRAAARGFAAFETF